MGKTIINGIEYSGSGATNADQLPYDNTKSTKDKIDELKNNLPKVLWENPNPNANFAINSKITLSSDDYDYFEIICKWSVTDSRPVSSTVLKGYNESFIIEYVSSSSNNLRLYYRIFSMNSSTEFICTASREQPHGSSYVDNASIIIPLKVIGYKL